MKANLKINMDKTMMVLHLQIQMPSLVALGLRDHSLNFLAHLMKKKPNQKIVVHNLVEAIRTFNLQPSKTALFDKPNTGTVAPKALLSTFYKM